MKSNIIDILEPKEKDVSSGMHMIGGDSQFRPNSPTVGGNYADDNIEIEDEELENDYLGPLDLSPYDWRLGGIDEDEANTKFFGGKSPVSLPSGEKTSSRFFDIKTADKDEEELGWTKDLSPIFFTAEQVSEHFEQHPKTADMLILFARGGKHLLQGLPYPAGKRDWITGHGYADPVEYHLTDGQVDFLKASGLGLTTNFLDFFRCNDKERCIAMPPYSEEGLGSGGRPADHGGSKKTDKSTRDSIASRLCEEDPDFCGGEGSDGGDVPIPSDGAETMDDEAGAYLSGARAGEGNSGVSNISMTATNGNGSPCPGKTKVRNEDGDCVEAPSESASGAGTSWAIDGHKVESPDPSGYSSESINKRVSTLCRVLTALGMNDTSDMIFKVADDNFGSGVLETGHLPDNAVPSGNMEIINIQSTDIDRFSKELGPDGPAIATILKSNLVKFFIDANSAISYTGGHNWSSKSRSLTDSQYIWILENWPWMKPDSEPSNKRLWVVYCNGSISGDDCNNEGIADELERKIEQAFEGGIDGGELDTAVVPGNVLHGDGSGEPALAVAYDYAPRHHVEGGASSGCARLIVFAEGPEQIDAEKIRCQSITEGPNEGEMLCTDGDGNDVEGLRLSDSGGLEYAESAYRATKDTASCYIEKRESLLKDGDIQLHMSCGHGESGHWLEKPFPGGYLGGEGLDRFFITISRQDDKALNQPEGRLWELHRQYFMPHDGSITGRPKGLRVPISRDLESQRTFDDFYGRDTGEQPIHTDAGTEMGGILNEIWRMNRLFGSNKLTITEVTESSDARTNTSQSKYSDDQLFLRKISELYSAGRVDKYARCGAGYVAAGEAGSVYDWKYSELASANVYISELSKISGLMLRFIMGEVHLVDPKKNVLLDKGTQDSLRARIRSGASSMGGGNDNFESVEHFTSILGSAGYWQ
jgi:hypothetical protein